MNESKSLSRDQLIIRTSLIGILTNFFLAAFKAAVGILSHSIAVILDAVNNLSDALSSLITILGTKLAGRAPDRKHPLGHGRIEYLSALIVSAIVLYAGITSLVESVRKIISPEPADYSYLTLGILAVAIVVKLVLGAYVKKQGHLAHSNALIASGSDASFDAILSASVLASALVWMFLGISLEAWVGVIISGFIIKAGIEMMKETLDDILGTRADSSVTREIKEILTDDPAVRGAYDLFLHNYGPDRNYGSVHLELDDTMTVEDVDQLTRKLESEVYRKTGVILTGIGVYSYNTQNDEAARIRDKVRDTVLSHDWALQVHGFHADIQNKAMRFDVVFSFETSRQQALKTVCEEIQALYPDWSVSVTPDVDITD